MVRILRRPDSNPSEALVNGNPEKILDAKMSRLLTIAICLILALSAAGHASNSESVVYSFTDGNDGGVPYGGLIFDGAGNLYGTTSEGGAYEVGAVYKLAPKSTGGWTESAIYSFTGGSDGEDPLAGLTIDAMGNLYGTTHFGGVAGSSDCCGTVFELSPTATGWQYFLLYSFTGGIDGAYPWAALTLDASGDIYGTAFEGGKNGAGTVFELKRTATGGRRFTLIHTFTDGEDGGYPSGNLLFDQAGELYGTTSFGGILTCYSLGCGVAYKLTPGGGEWRETVMHTFTDGLDGEFPNSGFIADSAGNLYGVVGGGGTHGNGIVYELIPSSGIWKFRVLHSFIGKPDGASPYGSLIFDSMGNLYGTSQGGGETGFGTAFELMPSSGKWNCVLLHSFYESHSDGADPNGSLVVDSFGNFYGSAGGGELAAGVVFALTPNVGDAENNEPSYMF